MSYLVAIPELVASAATDLAGVGAAVSAASATATAPTTGLLATGPARPAAEVPKS
jgi:hypothetical protein